MRITVTKTLAGALVAMAAAMTVPAQAASRATAATPAGCPANRAPVTQGSKWTGNASGTTYDASGTSFTQTKDNLLPVVLNGGGTCLVNVKVTGNFATSMKWWDLKQCCNGAGVTVNAPATLVNPRIVNASTDGIRIWKSAAVTVRGAYETGTRDDCISAITHGDLVVDDSLMDGCHTGISWRSGSKSAPSFKLRVTNSLFYVKPQANSGSGGNCKEWVTGGKANGTMWKMDNFKGPIYVENTVIRMDLANHQCVDLWPSGTFKNVKLVWNNTKAYPGKLPAGVTLTRDVGVWNAARTAWLQAHGYPTA
jgi:hypothetical protein